MNMKHQQYFWLIKGVVLGLLLFVVVTFIPFGGVNLEWNWKHIILKFILFMLIGVGVMFVDHKWFHSSKNNQQ